MGLPKTVDRRRSLHSARIAFRRSGHPSNAVLAQMLGDFKGQPDLRRAGLLVLVLVDPKGAVNVRELPLRKLDIHNRPDDLNHFPCCAQRKLLSTRSLLNNTPHSIFPITLLSTAVSGSRRPGARPPVHPLQPKSNGSPGPYTGRGKRAHGAMNKERHVGARRRVGEAAGPAGLVADRTRTSYFNASAPPTMSINSLVMAACRVLL